MFLCCIELHSTHPYYKVTKRTSSAKNNVRYLLNTLLLLTATITMSLFQPFPPTSFNTDLAELAFASPVFVCVFVGFLLMFVNVGGLRRKIHAMRACLCARACAHLSHKDTHCCVGVVCLSIIFSIETGLVITTHLRVALSLWQHLCLFLSTKSDTWKEFERTTKEIVIPLVKPDPCLCLYTTRWTHWVSVGRLKPNAICYVCYC